MTYTFEKSAEGSNLKWPSTTITWSIAAADYPADGKPNPFNIDDTLSFSALPGLITKAMGAWAGVSGLRFVRVPDSPTVDIRIGLGTVPAPDLATTTYHYSYPPARFKPDTTIVLADPADHAVSGDLTYANTAATMQQVLTREIGHALGLGTDSSDQSAVMWKDASALNRKLDADDIAAIRALYGGHPGAAAPPPILTPTNPRAAVGAIDSADLQIASRPSFLFGEHAGLPVPASLFSAGAVALTDLTPSLTGAGQPYLPDAGTAGWDTGLSNAALFLHSLG